MSTPAISPIKLNIDGQTVEVAPGQSVLDAARKLGVDIPTLCYLEKCGPLNSCLVCLVKINGRLVPSCGTAAQEGMAVESETEEVHEARRTALELLFSDHIGDCLSPCSRLCPLGLNIPVMLRQIQDEQLAEAVTTVRGSLPLPGVLGRLCHHPCEQGCRRGHWDDPAAIREMERFVTDWERGRKPGETAPAAPFVPPRRAATGRTVAVVGAGPTGLAAAYRLLRNGHAVTVLDRNPQPGGSLCSVPPGTLPPEVLADEIEGLRRLGLELELGVEIGKERTLEALARNFDAVLIAIGESTAADLQAIGAPAAGAFLRVDPNTCRTAAPAVFAAGAVAKPVKQLVRAMAEGFAAAECIHRQLSGQPVRRPEKPFSSVMGRLSPGELKQFLLTSNSGGSISPCDACAGHTRREAVAESARCLNCDCRSSGNCVLQHYAQVYGADANRYRSERKPFEQHLQPGGVVFEPGKCILCGICVKLTELAREPLGLTFIGRGFEVRVGTPLNHSIEQGLQRTAAECIEHCPTGALAWAVKAQPTAPAAVPGRG